MSMESPRRRAPSAPSTTYDINGTNEDDRIAKARRASAATDGKPSPLPASSSTRSMSHGTLATSRSSDTSPSYKLTQDEIDFIARTETSSWYARAEPTKAYESDTEPGMEPHLPRRSDSSDSYGMRPSTALSAATTGWRAVNWASGGRSSSKTSMDTQNAASSSPKRSTFARSDLPRKSSLGYGYNESSNGYGNVQKMGTGGLLRPQKLRPQRLNIFDAFDNTSDYYSESALRRLPEEIILLIVAELRTVHLDADEKKRTCPTCYMRDVCSLTLANRQFMGPAKKVMYETIITTGSDSMGHIKKRFRVKYGTRLKLLRRTLRANPGLAELVKTIRVPSHMEAGAGSSKKDQLLYDDIVASIVMACPNLERLVGFYPHYDYDYSRISHALSTRTRLAEQLWNIDGQPSFQTSYARSVGGYGVPLSDQARAFISHHSGWDFLRTLAIHCRPTSAFDASVLEPLWSHLPSLRHLALSSLSPPPDFIMHLPPLASLHLSIISTATAQTLIDLTRAPLTATLSSLTLSLLQPDVMSVVAIGRILSSLPSLSQVSFFSPTPLVLPAGTTVFLHPYIASPRLKFLHWDIPSSPQTSEVNCNDANYILAKAIDAGGFPKLRRLRAPRDYDGILQRTCRPSSGFDTPLIAPSFNGNGRNGQIPTGRRKGSETSMPSNTSGASGHAANVDSSSGPTSELREARQAAQARIDLAKLKPRWKIACEDWSTPNQVRVTARFDAGGFVGTIGSRVTYWLEEDGIEGLEGLLHGRSSYEECNGSWNARQDEKRGWGSAGPGAEWHTPREKGWNIESLDRLF
ncbi:hypothetical protein VC83_01191 [Pseudogymnoascus destructans]|uniref:Uncharacterized protein n=2 Tax=Pseudogymnoascus destructans TaxID=655981 RepID=L8FYI6_PSED2|nr:uncharacterized protein VC83_01191 [Pseudogymnoascus destructans]ELR04766.1 hypothetical protein GMDG_06994 [Pseudogymnoascus destructans 20631-21]OAF62206.1 hypothetical protein VC83_01191 [Pseudogymnoascus destructans]